MFEKNGAFKIFLIFLSMSSNNNNGRPGLIFARIAPRFIRVISEIHVWHTFQSDIVKISQCFSIN